MLNHRTKQWCERAVSGIEFPPDKKEVYQELANHIYDHYDYLIEQGCDRDTAIERAIEAMGDPYVIARQLAEIHRPFWGYFLRAARILLVATFAIAIIPLSIFVYNYYSQSPKNELPSRYDPFEDSYVSDEICITERVMYLEPRQVRKSDGYTLTLTRVAWSNTQYADPTIEGSESFCFQLEIFNPLPWADEPNIDIFLWAKDSEGNLYYPMTSGVTSAFLSGDMEKTAPLTWTLEMWLNNFCSQDAKWIDIYYNRDGRNIRFHIDLRGGDTK